MNFFASFVERGKFDSNQTISSRPAILCNTDCNSLLLGKISILRHAFLKASSRVSTLYQRQKEMEA